jgi:hypothetical protein
MIATTSRGVISTRTVRHQPSSPIISAGLVLADDWTRQRAQQRLSSLAEVWSPVAHDAAVSVWVASNQPHPEYKAVGAQWELESNDSPKQILWT